MLAIFTANKMKFGNNGMLQGTNLCQNDEAKEPTNAKEAKKFTPKTMKYDTVTFKES